jgi:hypothetical protein
MMPLDSQEENAIRLALPILDSLWGSGWGPPDGSTLNESYPSVPTPECVVSNGTLDAAVEVKRLTGDSVWQE